MSGKYDFDPIDDTDGNPDSPGGSLNFEWLSPEDRNFVERATARQAMIREHLQAETPTEPAMIPSSVPTLAPTTILPNQTQLPSAFPTTSPDDPDALPPLIARSFTPVPTRLPSTGVPVRVPMAVPTTPSVPIPSTVSQPSAASQVDAPRRSSRAN